MISDQDLYNKIGQILFNISPDNTKTVIMQAKVWPQGDASEFKFNYITNDQKSGWLDPDGNIIDDLHNLLKKLKQYTLDNNLTNGQPIWTGCIVTIDIENAKINVEFKYESFIEQ